MLNLIVQQSDTLQIKSAQNKESNAVLN